MVELESRRLAVLCIRSKRPGPRQRDPAAEITESFAQHELGSPCAPLAIIVITSDRIAGNQIVDILVKDVEAADVATRDDHIYPQYVVISLQI